MAAAAGPPPEAPSVQHGSMAGGQPRAAAPVTVAAARQAMLLRLQQLLGNPPLGPGGGAGAEPDPPRALLPATLLNEAVAFPSLVSTAAQRAQAQQQHQQSQQRQQRPAQQHPQQRAMPASVPARTVSQLRSFEQPAGWRGGQQPSSAGIRNAAHWPPGAVTPAAVRSAPAASDSPVQLQQRAAFIERPAGSRLGTTPPPNLTPALPARPQGTAAFHPRPQPRYASRGPYDAHESDEETADEAPAPPAKRQRRRTAAAAAGLAARQQPAKASECEPCLARRAVTPLANPCTHMSTSPDLASKLAPHAASNNSSRLALAGIGHKRHYSGLAKLQPCRRRYKGVKLHRRSGQWEAQIKSAGKLVYLGIYEEEGEAAEAYDQALIAVQVRPAGDDHSYMLMRQTWARKALWDFRGMGPSYCPSSPLLN